MSVDKFDISKINLSPSNLKEATEVIFLLVKVIIELKEENDKLKEQLKLNSNNSSKPPSSDSFTKKKKPKNKHKGSGKKRGDRPQTY